MADRYHVLVNLRDTLKAALARHQSSLPVLQGDEEPEALSPRLTSEEPETASVPAEMPKAEGEFSPCLKTANLHPQTAAERRRQTSRANRLARYEHIVALLGQGFRGSASLVGQRLSHWRAGLPEPPKRGRAKKRRPVPRVTRQLSSRQASWLFITPKEQLTAQQQALLERTCQNSGNSLNWGKTSC